MGKILYFCLQKSEDSPRIKTKRSYYDYRKENEEATS
jgi:hypothetical protein